VGVGIGAATDEGTAFEEGDVGAVSGEGGGGGEAGYSGADDDDVLML
jgi:hypothetical protein